MSDASTAGAPAAPAATETAPNAAAPVEDLIDLELEPGKPIKVPRSKLDPHLAKYRAEIDKRASKVDLDTKALGDRQSKLEAVLKAAKESPDDALKALGLDPDAFADAKLAARVKAAMQAADEEADPTKKTARERDEELEALRKKVADADKEKDERTRQDALGRLKGFVDAVILKLPEEVRDFAKADTIAIVRQAMAEIRAGKRKDITIEEAAKAAQAQIVARLTRAQKLLGQPPKPAVVHPAVGARPKLVPKPASTKDESPGAGDFLQNLIFGAK